MAHALLFCDLLSNLKYYTYLCKSFHVFELFFSLMASVFCCLVSFQLHVVYLASLLALDT